MDRFGRRGGGETRLRNPHFKRRWYVHGWGGVATTTIAVVTDRAVGWEKLMKFLKGLGFKRPRG